MKNFRVSSLEAKTRNHQRASVRILLIASVCVAGLALAGMWYSKNRQGPAAPVVGQPDPSATIVLSEPTRTVLQQLPSAVEIRYYSVLDPGSVPESTRAFANRAFHLLVAFQREANGKLAITRHASETHAPDAARDGIQGFNRDKGDTCYFGLVLVHKDNREVLPQLFPEWEAALEYDLARMLARVTTAPAALKPPAPLSPGDKAVEEAVRLAIPNIAATSLDEGRRLLREAALKDFTSAAAEMEKKIAAAQKQVSEAQEGKSAAEREALVKELQQAQLEQAEKLKEIAARLQDQITTWERLKSEAR